ncbi:MAG: FAD-binding oxidoreductase, partial [Candidatus Cloacimonetes bacterium]|nr:FAD-binding oxidoreductase [Candidatus Cloacimonadota bacterium]
MGLVSIERLKGIVGEENVKDDIADLYVYGSDASVHEAMPWVVVRPHKIEEVQNIMRYANSELIPVIPRGSASSTSGHTV